MKPFTVPPSICIKSVVGKDSLQTQTASSCGKSIKKKENIDASKPLKQNTSITENTKKLENELEQVRTSF